MQNKKKVLLGLMAACLAGTVGSAFALTRNSITGTATSGAFDSAIYLYWDSQSTTSANLTNITSVSVNTPVYRFLTVSPRSTKSVSGTVTLTFTLAPETGCVVTGLTVSVYETSALSSDLSVTTDIDGVTPTPVLSASNLSDTTTFAVTTDTTAHETVKYYAIKVNYDGTAMSTLGGTVTIAQSFAVAGA